MGRISRSQLRELPFSLFEYFGGVYDRRQDRYYALPLVGYEADTWWRVAPLRLWNALNIAWARRGPALRIAIHPNDFELKLAEDLSARLRKDLVWASYQTIV